MPFDPDAYLAESSAPAFDPDKYLGSGGGGNSYWDTYNQMRQEGQAQMARGIEGIKNIGGIADLKDTRKTFDPLLFGAMEYVGSPINAALRHYISQPLENKTGIPKEYTETAASILPMFRRAPPAAASFEAAAMKGAAKQSYAAADQAGVSANIPAKAAQALRTDMEDTLYYNNVRGKRAEPIKEAISKEFPADGSADLDAGHLVNLHQELRSAGGPAEALLPKVESALKQYSPSAWENVQRARADYNAGSIVERLDKKFQKAEAPNTRLYTGDKIRTAAQQALTDRDSAFLKPSDVTALRGVAEGTRLQNALRGFAQESRGLPAQVGLGAYTHGIGNILLAGPAWAARGLYNNSVARSADLARQSIAMRAPLYASQAANIAAKQRAIMERRELTNAMRGVASMGLLAPQSGGLLGH